MHFLPILLSALLSSRALGITIATKRSFPLLVPRQTGNLPIGINATGVASGNPSFGTGAACKKPTTLPTTTNPPTTSTPTPTSTISCSMQEQDPDNGIDSAYCICEGKTLPLRTLSGTTAIYTASCAYPFIPTGTTATISPTVAHEPPVTNIALCQVCTLISDTGDTPPTCTTISGCIPQKAVASVTAGSSPVHVGTLTGAALYTSVSSALLSLCPDPTQTTGATQCDETGSVSIGGISYVEDESLETDGDFVVSIDSSSYNSSELRIAMINSISLSINASAVNGNCYSQSYTVEEARKRANVDPPSSWGWVSSKLGLSGAPTLGERDHPYPVQEKIQFCNAIEFAAANYYNQYWRLAPKPGPTDFIYANFAFHIGPGGDFACDFLQDLTDALAIIQPEFAVEDVELGEAIDAICCGSLEC